MLIHFRFVNNLVCVCSQLLVRTREVSKNTKPCTCSLCRYMEKPLVASGEDDYILHPRELPSFPVEDDASFDTSSNVASSDDHAAAVASLANMLDYAVEQPESGPATPVEQAATGFFGDSAGNKRLFFSPRHDQKARSVTFSRISRY